MSGEIITVSSGNVRLIPSDGGRKANPTVGGEATTAGPPNYNPISQLATPECAL